MIPNRGKYPFIAIVHCFLTRWQSVFKARPKFEYKSTSGAVCHPELVGCTCLISAQFEQFQTKPCVRSCQLAKHHASLSRFSLKFAATQRAAVCRRATCGMSLPLALSPLLWDADANGMHHSHFNAHTLYNDAHSAHCLQIDLKLYHSRLGIGPAERRTGRSSPRLCTSADDRVQRIFDEAQRAGCTSDMCKSLGRGGVFGCCCSPRREETSRDGGRCLFNLVCNR